MARLIIIPIICSVLLTPSVSWAADTQFWNTYSAEKVLAKHWRISAEEELRIGDDINKLLYYHTDFEIIHTAKNWLELGLGYQYVRAKKIVLWENEHRPHFNVTFLGKSELFEVFNKSRIEHRFLSDTKDFWRYRNKTKLQLNFKVKDRQIKPYISEEYFMDFDQPEFNFNRFAVGLEIQLTKNIDGEAYYLRQDQDDRGIEPKADVVGLTLKLTF